MTFDDELEIIKKDVPDKLIVDLVKEYGWN
jgi:hypothetical protein